MKRIFLFLFCLISANVKADDWYLVYENEDYSFDCKSLTKKIERCENKEVICYIYDTYGEISGRGAGISCIKK